MNPKETDRGPVQRSREQRRELQNARDHHPKPPVRERSAAFLQMAEGKSPHWVATHGVLKPRKPDTRLALGQLVSDPRVGGLGFPRSRVVRCGGGFLRRAELIERLRRGPVPEALGKPAATRWTLARGAFALTRAGGLLAKFRLEEALRLGSPSAIRTSASLQPRSRRRAESRALVCGLARGFPCGRSSAWWCSWTTWATAAFRKPAADWMPEAPTPVRVAERFGSR